MIVLKDYQSKAVGKLYAEAVELLSLGERRKSLVFESPTGSGKTIMMADWLKHFVENIASANLPQKDYAFVWIAPQQLHVQSRLKLKSFYEEKRTLRCLEFGDLSGGGMIHGDLLFLNWASINKDENVIIRDNERGFNLDSVIAKTKAAGVEVIVVIDEAHFGKGAEAKRAQKRLSEIDAILEIDVTATPETKGDAHVKVHRKAVIDAEMIKKGVQLNSGIKPSGNMSLNQFILSEALKQRARIAKAYEESGSHVRPLLLVQLPNDAEKLNPLDTKVREELEAYLAVKGITAGNGKLAVWLSGSDKANLDGIENYDSTVEVLIFKQAIALGWDCPRAHVLAIYRDIKSFQFGIQTVGRILRMPEQIHYGLDLLDYGYVYTNLAANMIEFVREEAQYLQPLRALRVSDARDLILQKDFLDTRIHRLRLRSSILWRAFKEAAISAALMSEEESVAKGLSDGERHVENANQWGVLLSLQPSKIDVQIPKDIHLDRIEVGVQKRLDDQHRLRYARNMDELRVVVMKLMQSLCGPYEKAEGVGVMYANLVRFLEEYFGLDELDALKVLGYGGNARFWAEFVTTRVLHHYQAHVERRNADNPPKVEHLNWNWPHERFYNPATYEPQASDAHSLAPFVQENTASSPEKAFAAYLDEHADYVEHWYKNGDHGKEHFSIAYQNGAGQMSLFYVDFIVRLVDGTVALFDTKTPNSDPEMGRKHNALVDYVASEKGRFDGKLIGGIIIPSNELWLYPTVKIDANAPTDTHGWRHFNPKKPWDAVIEAARRERGCGPVIAPAHSEEDNLFSRAAAELVTPVAMDAKAFYRVTVDWCGPQHYDSWKPNFDLSAGSKVMFSLRPDGVVAKFDRSQSKYLKMESRDGDVIKRVVELACQGLLGRELVGEDAFATAHTHLTLKVERSVDGKYPTNAELVDEMSTRAISGHPSTLFGKFMSVVGTQANSDDWEG